MNFKKEASVISARQLLQCSSRDTSMGIRLRRRSGNRSERCPWVERCVAVALTSDNLARANAPREISMSRTAMSKNVALAYQIGGNAPQPDHDHVCRVTRVLGQNGHADRNLYHSGNVHERCGLQVQQLGSQRDSGTSPSS